MAVRLLDKSVDLTEAQAASFAHFLGRKEWFEDVVNNLGRHTLAGVGHYDTHMVASKDAPLDLAARRADRNVRALDTQLAASGHRVTRIYHEVEDGGLELDWIDAAMP